MGIFPSTFIHVFRFIKQLLAMFLANEIWLYFISCEVILLNFAFTSDESILIAV